MFSNSVFSAISPGNDGCSWFVHYRSKLRYLNIPNTKNVKPNRLQRGIVMITLPFFWETQYDLDRLRGKKNFARIPQDADQSRFFGPFWPSLVEFSESLCSLINPYLQTLQTQAWWPAWDSSGWDWWTACEKWPQSWALKIWWSILGFSRTTKLYQVWLFGTVTHTKSIIPEVLTSTSRREVAFFFLFYPDTSIWYAIYYDIPTVDKHETIWMRGTHMTICQRCL